MRWGANGELVDENWCIHNVMQDPLIRHNGQSVTSTLWTAYAFNPRIVDMTFKPHQINQRESDHTWKASPLPFTTCSMNCAHLNFTNSTKEKVTIPGKHVLCLSTYVARSTWHQSVARAKLEKGSCRSFHLLQGRDVQKRWVPRLRHAVQPVTMRIGWNLKKKGQLFHIT